jgi:hypothetical protein
MAASHGHPWPVRSLLGGGAAKVPLASRLLAPPGSQGRRWAAAHGPCLAARRPCSCAEWRAVIVQTNRRVSL